VSRAADILRLLQLSRAYALRLVLSGAEEAWMVAAEIAAAEIPVIIDPTENLPSSFSSLHSSRDNARRLHEAGVLVGFSTFDAHMAHNLRQLAGNAMAHGLPRAAALAALTSVPARCFGMSRDYGELTPGRVANFSIWTGDPFELGSWAESVVVHGLPASLRTRQSLLFERYRDLQAVPRGRLSPPAAPAAPAR
jgi:imidazolonepropionase-like amidohydrolase